MTRLAFVLPRNMCFSPQGATAIDLYVHDLVQHLPPACQPTVYAAATPQPFAGVSLVTIPRRRWLDKKMFLGRIIAALRTAAPSVVLVQQHLPSAARIARALPQTPVVLQTHNFQSETRSAFKRLRVTADYKTLAAISFVSESCAAHYRQHWHAMTLPTFVVPNGIDAAAFTPQAARANVVQFVGRLTPDKGVLPLAEALARVLPHFPDWHADFIVGEADRFPDYAAAVRAALAPVQSQVSWRTQQPWAAVRAAYESAAVAVVPSAYQEAFGRTALEAMAGGAALIASVNGGLGEVVGDAAVRLPNVNADSIEQALRLLMADVALRADYAARGRARAAHYSLTSTVAELQKLVETVG